MTPASLFFRSSSPTAELFHHQPRSGLLAASGRSRGHEITPKLYQPLDHFLSSFLPDQVPKSLRMAWRKDKEVLFNFNDFPAQTLTHLRTLPPLIPFATGRLRTHRTQRFAVQRIATLDYPGLQQNSVCKLKAVAPAPGFRADFKGNYPRPVS